MLGGYFSGSSESFSDPDSDSESNKKTVSVPSTGEGSR